MEPELSSLSYSVVLFVIALFIRGLLSFLETSITALRLFNLKQLAATTSHRYQRLFTALETEPQRVLITILLANSLADVTTAALATNIMERIFAHLQFSGGVGFSVGVFTATIAIVVFGEIIPKNLARSFGIQVFGSILWIIYLAYIVLYPITMILLAFANAVVRLFRGSKATEDQSDWTTCESEIRFLISHIGQKGLMESEKSQMLQNIFELAQKPVREIMVPDTNIISIDIEASLEQALQLFSTHNFTRLPVYRAARDNIIGIIHLKDIFLLLSHAQTKELKELIRPIMFVPESMKINQLLKQLREQHMHMAIALNEHGSLIGLITLEDILEEIVGEISDEHEATAAKIIAYKNGSWLVDGGVPLQELTDALKITFDRTEIVTIGGFITDRLQHLPKKGERVIYQGYKFKVEKASPKRVLKVLISPHPVSDQN
jgi:putative hemolysin